MNFCRSGVVCFIHPEHVLRDEPVVHYGEAPRAAASFNNALQRTAAGRRGCNRRASWPPSLSLGR